MSQHETNNPLSTLFTGKKSRKRETLTLTELFYLRRACEISAKVYEGYESELAFKALRTRLVELTRGDSLTIEKKAFKHSDKHIYDSPPPAYHNDRLGVAKKRRT